MSHAGANAMLHDVKVGSKIFTLGHPAKFSKTVTRHRVKNFYKKKIYVSGVVDIKKLIENVPLHFKAFSGPVWEIELFESWEQSQANSVPVYTRPPQKA